MADTITPYLDLVTPEYQDSPNFLSFLQIFLQKLDDAYNCAQAIEAAFDLDNAVGTQLDMLGQIAGATRLLPFQPSNGANPMLGDDDYRVLIKATIGRNMWDGRIDTLYPLWKNLYPNGSISIQDNQNMTMTVYLTGNFSSIQIDMITNGLIIPRPEGVLINYALGTYPLFGFDQDNSYISGFDKGNWYMV